MLGVQPAGLGGPGSAGRLEQCARPRLIRGSSGEPQDLGQSDARIGDVLAAQSLQCLGGPGRVPLNSQALGFKNGEARAPGIVPEIAGASVRHRGPAPVAYHPEAAVVERAQRDTGCRLLLGA